MAIENDCLQVEYRKKRKQYREYFSLAAIPNLLSISAAISGRNCYDTVLYKAM